MTDENKIREAEEQVKLESQPIPAYSDQMEAFTTQPASPPLAGLYAPKTQAPTFTGEATKALALARTIGIVDPMAGSVRVGSVSIFGKSKQLGAGEFKLLNLGIGAFTEINTQNRKNPQLRIYADTKEYARACGVTIDPVQKDNPKAQEAENRRAAKALDNFVMKLRKNAQILRKEAAFTGDELIQGRKSTYAEMPFIGAWYIDQDVIFLEFTQSAAEYLVRLPLTLFPRSFFAIDDRKPNAIAIAMELYHRYSMDNNVIKNTERIIKVENLLAYTSLPKYDPNDRYRSRWDSRIKEPFEAALDELKAKGFLADWKYCRAKKIELSDEEAGSILRYEQFASLYLYYELADFASHDERLTLLLEKRKEQIEKAEKKRRKRRKDKEKADREKDQAQDLGGGAESL